MTMRFFSVLCSVLVVLEAVHARVVHADEAFHRPTPGNQFVTTTDKYLYVVWSVPKDLAPFAGIKSADALEAFIGRTAVFLCHEHRAVEPNQAKPCKVQVVRMNSNDEYTKSAAGGWKTVAELLLPRQHASDAALARAKVMPLPKLKATFTKFSVKHDRIQLPSAP
jgi:hypothetical protein